MAKNSIFPEEIIKNTVEYHSIKHGKKTTHLFSAILLFTLSAVIFMPIVKVDIFSTARGLIISDKEIISLNSPMSGKVVFSSLKENRTYNKGDTLLVIEQSKIDGKIVFLDSKIEENKDFIRDLEYLSNGEKKKIKTQRFREELFLYQGQISSFNVLIDNAAKEFNRYKTLYDKDVISLSEFEDKKLNLSRVRNEKREFILKTRLSWQTEKVKLNQEIETIGSDKTELLEEKNNHVLIAPIDGELIDSKGVEKGNFIIQNSTMGLLSPISDLIVESYVSPADIGFLKLGMEVVFQVDSYNSNQWGFATGKIIDIGKDIITSNDAFSFKVKCSIDQNTLRLKNGVKGNLKKGMTLTSRFFLTKRSLWQILFDKTEDWFNPYISDQDEQKG
nr:HlyD family secretion protein [uncultured Allomuricauda sp.]